MWGVGSTSPTCFLCLLVAEAGLCWQLLPEPSAPPAPPPWGGAKPALLVISEGGLPSEGNSKEKAEGEEARSILQVCGPWPGVADAPTPHTHLQPQPLAGKVSQRAAGGPRTLLALALWQPSLPRTPLSGRQPRLSTALERRQQLWGGGAELWA